MHVCFCLCECVGFCWMYVSCVWEDALPSSFFSFSLMGQNTWGGETVLCYTRLLWCSRSVYDDDNDGWWSWCDARSSPSNDVLLLPTRTLSPLLLGVFHHMFTSPLALAKWGRTKPPFLLLYDFLCVPAAFTCMLYMLASSDIHL